MSDEYDFPAREEHGGQGRWTSPDPMRGTGNKYVYADNNPLSKVDPYGLLAVVSDGIEMGSYDELAGMGVNPIMLSAESQPSQTTQTGPQATTNSTDTSASGASTTQTAQTQQAEQTAQQQRNGQQAKQAQNTCQSGNCNVKVIGDTGKDNGGAGTPNPFVAGTNQREITYQAVDQKGHAVSGAEISLHETPLTGKEGGDAKNYSYASGKGSSNSEKGDEGANRAGQFNDLLTTGGKGPAGFRQTFTVEGKSANIIWPTGHGDVVAPSQKVLDTPSRIIIIPEVNQ